MGRSETARSHQEVRNTKSKAADIELERVGVGFRFGSSHSYFILTSFVVTAGANMLKYWVALAVSQAFAHAERRQARFHAEGNP